MGQRFDGIMSKKQRQPIFHLNKNDVLKGRGNGPQNHPGNIQFREFVNNYKFEYVSSNKKDKKQFCEKIFKQVKDQCPPGRFIEKEAKVDIWYELDKEAAMKKISQALRENASDMKAAMETEGVNEQMAKKDNAEPEGLKESSIDTFDMPGIMGSIESIHSEIFNSESMDCSLGDKSSDAMNLTRSNSSMKSRHDSLSSRRIGNRRSSKIRIPSMRSSRTSSERMSQVSNQSSIVSLEGKEFLSSSFTLDTSMDDMSKDVAYSGSFSEMSLGSTDEIGNTGKHKILKQLKKYFG